MGATLGRNATAMHLLLVASLAMPAVAILVVVVLAIPRDTEMLWVLVVVVSAPFWIVGIVAGIEAVAVARGRQVSGRRAAAFALVGVVGGAVLAWTQGVFSFVATLVDRPGDIDLGWPVSIIWTRDRSGTDSYHLDAAGIWVAVAWCVLGVASLVASARDVRGDHTGTRADSDPSDAAG